MVMRRSGSKDAVALMPEYDATQTDATLALLHFFSGAHLLDKEVWGDATTAALMRGIMMGTLENRPFDTGALANHLRIPHQTVVRRVNQMEDRGLIRKRKNGRRYELTATDKGLSIGMDRNKDYIDLVRRTLSPGFST